MAALTGGNMLLPRAEDVSETPCDTKSKKLTLTWTTVCSYLVTMLACATLALVGIRGFLDAPTMSGGHDLGKPAGYGPWNVVGLATWFYFAPVVAVLAFTLTINFMNNPICPKEVKFVWTFTAAVASFSLSVVSATLLAKDVLACGVIFCAGESKQGDQEPSTAFNNSIGLGLVVLYFGLGVAFATIFVRHFVIPKRDVRSIQQKSLKARIHARQWKRVSAALALAIVVLPTCLLLTAILPNGFQGFQSHSISESMAQEVLNAELPRAWMRTQNWKWSESVVLKFFPDTVLFYGFLEVLALGAIASAMHPPLGKWFARPVRNGVTIGECLAGSLLVFMIMAWVFYWLHDHQYHGGKADMDPIWSERIARTCGMTAVLFMSLCLLPASKNSLWLQALGISWESSVWLHRWLGGLSILWALAHVISFWVRYSELQIMPHDILTLVPFYPLNFQKPTVPKGDNWTMPLMMLVAYPSFFMIGLPQFWRKKNWEVFKYLHFVFLALIPATLFHAASAWLFMLGGIAFYLVDVLLRFVSTASPCQLHSAVAHEAEGGITELRFEKAFSEPGQYCFVNVPAVSHWEWHPFSLCSSPFDGEVQMCIKNMGQGTFTGRLFELVKAEQGASRGPLVINVDGPYGPPLDPSNHASIVLIAGGIGITPIHSTFRTLSQLARQRQLPRTLKHVRLVWVGRSANLFSILASSVRECVEHAMPEGAPSFHATFYLDDPMNLNPTCATSKDLGIHTEAGRPNMSELLDTVIHEHVAESTALVQCCGPPPMANAVEKIALQKPEVVYQSELFAL